MVNVVFTVVFFCSNVNLILEQLCLEGNRKQAKYAVSAIAAMSGDSGLMALSVLYGVCYCFYYSITCLFLYYYQIKLAGGCCG